jgi:hypothetical protein
MAADAQEAWFEAARLALSDVPADLLKRGAQHAMLHADHPSKIVSLIMREIGEELTHRRRPVGSDIWAGADNRPAEALPAPGQERCTPGELDAICKRFAVGRYAKEQPRREPTQPVNMGKNPDRACREPTRADYLRLGVHPSTLDAIDAERRAA